MKKIPTIFLRDWENPKHPITAAENPACGWVFRGEGVATRKLDGTACLIHKGRLYKRRELQSKQAPPDGYIREEYDPETQKDVGWVPVGDGPEDQYHREAFQRFRSELADDDPDYDHRVYEYADGTYELVGPHIQSNPEHLEHDQLIRHGEGLAGPLEEVPRTFGNLLAYFKDDEPDIEGIVWHHPDGHMAKIKGRDFGLRRPSVVPSSKAATGTDPSR